MAALAGGADHCASTISCGEPGVACGARLFDTMSKMPALLRSLNRVVSKTALQRRRLRIVAHRLEIRGRQADVLVAEVGSSVNPVLGCCLDAKKIRQGKQKQGQNPQKLPSCDVHSFLEFWDGVVHGPECGLLQAAYAAQSFDAASAPEGDRSG